MLLNITDIRINIQRGVKDMFCLAYNITSLRNYIFFSISQFTLTNIYYYLDLTAHFK
jgi:hypothetical protein